MADATVTAHEADKVSAANATGKQPVVFIHGLWLLPSSWDRWATLFDAAGYISILPHWPDDPETVAEAKADPEVFAGKSISDVADHLEAVVAGLDRKPAIVGHSFGGLMAQILAGRGRSRRPSPSMPHRSGASCRCRSRPSSRPFPCSAIR